ncbi:MAG: adenine methylase Dam [Firmicutes bacterium]|nr:adenine methylase Dam [Bacillota bacterium]
MSTAEPFLRWAGGKTWLLPTLPEIIGEFQFEHYHEPFLGGGAVFFSLKRKKRAYLSDANTQLVNVYVQVRDNPDELITFLQSIPNTKDDYYRIRNEITSDNTVENAARFLYLNQTSYNGLHRVNQAGRYNVPYGFRSKWTYDVERIRSASSSLENTRISFGDFETDKYRIKQNDLVFLDPPYTVSHNNNGFIAYNQNLFSLNDQQRLKRYIEYIKCKGAYYILTNAAHKTIRDIFFTQGDRIVELQRNSLIGGKFAERAMISEYIFTNIPEVHHE